MPFADADTDLSAVGNNDPQAVGVGDGGAVDADRLQQQARNRGEENCGRHLQDEDHQVRWLYQITLSVWVYTIS